MATTDFGLSLGIRRVGNFGNFCAGLDQANANAGKALFTHAELSCSRIGKVDNAGFGDRTAVIYA